MLLGSGEAVVTDRPYFRIAPNVELATRADIYTLKECLIARQIIAAAAKLAREDKPK